MFDKFFIYINTPNCKFITIFYLDERGRRESIRARAAARAPPMLPPRPMPVGRSTSQESIKVKSEEQKQKVVVDPVTKEVCCIHCNRKVFISIA